MLGARPAAGSQAEQGDRPDGAVRAAARGVDDRHGGAAVPRPGSRSGADRIAPRWARRTGGAAPARPRCQRPRVRARDGGAARSDAAGGEMTREQALRRLREQIAAGNAIVGAGAGTGLSAKSAEAGGADLIIIYNSGRYRMAGRGSLAGLMPYGDANAIVMEMASEVLTIVDQTPVLAG